MKRVNEIIKDVSQALVLFFIGWALLSIPFGG